MVADTALRSHSCCHEAKIHTLEEVSNDPPSCEVEYYHGLDDNIEEKAFGFSGDGMGPGTLASFSTTAPNSSLAEFKNVARRTTG